VPLDWLLRLAVGTSSRHGQPGARRL